MIKAKVYPFVEEKEQFKHQQTKLTRERLDHFYKDLRPFRKNHPMFGNPRRGFWILGTGFRSLCDLN